MNITVTTILAMIAIGLGIILALVAIFGRLSNELDLVLRMVAFAALGVGFANLAFATQPSATRLSTIFLLGVSGICLLSAATLLVVMMRQDRRPEQIEPHH